MNRARRLLPDQGAPVKVIATTRNRLAGTIVALAVTLLVTATTEQVLAQQVTPNYRDTDIRQVIEAVGAVTGRNFIVDSRIRGTVNLSSNTPMSPEEFYQAFLATLSVNGLVALDADGVTRIIPEANARMLHGTEPGVLLEDLVTRVVRLDHIGAAQMVPLLRPMIPQYGHLAAHPTSNTLIIVDRAGNIDRLMRVLRDVDRADVDDFDFIPLENASAADIVRMIGPMSQASQAAGGPPQVQVVADDRTNSIVLSGPRAGRMQYRSMIAYLDSPVDRAGESRVRYLFYADAEELAEKLQAQFGSNDEEGPVTIWSDRSTNALIYRAPPPVQADMNAIIDLLDIRRAQVVVDAIMVELTEQKAAELGMTWAILGAGDNAPLGLTNFGINPGGLLQLGAAAASGVPSPGAIPQGVTAGVGRVRDSATSWAALVSALQGDSTTNIVFNQSLTMLDNETAEATNGQEVPFVTGQYASGQTGTPGIVNPFTTIDRQPVGITLRVTPQINEGDGVKMVIELESSSISQTATSAVDLIKNTRNVVTSVFVEDGDILALGGLVDEKLLQGEQRVPGLGRIPGLGWMFRARNAERVNTNIMVFIRPTILRDRQQAIIQTGARYNYARDLQIQQAERGSGLLRDETIPMLPEFAPVPDATVELFESEETQVQQD